MSGRLARARARSAIKASERGEEDRGLPGRSTENTLMDQNGHATSTGDEGLDRRLEPDERGLGVLDDPLTAMLMNKTTQLNGEQHAAGALLDEVPIAKAEMR